MSKHQYLAVRKAETDEAFNRRLVGVIENFWRDYGMLPRVRMVAESAVVHGQLRAGALIGIRSDMLGGKPR